MSLAPHARLGPYEIASLVGAGGMGEVYKGKDTRLDRTVAIKVLPAKLAADPKFRERFDREARTISQLDHPHICALYDVGDAPNPESQVPNPESQVPRPESIRFLVMQYLEGETLADRLAKGALPLDQVLTIAIQIADALDKAHRAGIIHRDLKPGNIFLTKSGAKLLDFGLAKTGEPVVAGVGPSALTTTPPNLTAQGSIVGTMRYMAPEQLEGQEADARTDLFAFGCVLYEMLTGKKAFEARTQVSLIVAIMTTDPPPMASLQPLTPSLLDHIVRKCLDKDPAARWQSARDLLDALRWSHEGGGLPPARDEAPQSRRRQLTTWVLVVIAAVVGAIGAWAVRRPGPEQPRSVSRFALTLPPGQSLTRGGRHIVAVSPDGMKMAYVANRQIYLRALNQLDAVPIRGTDEDPTEPFFSPDGQWLAYFAGGHLKKIVVTGGAPVTLCEIGNPYGAAWTGDRIIVGAGPRGLVEVPAAGGTPRTLLSADAEKSEALHGPQLLPGSDTLLFTVRTGASRWDDGQIVVQSAKGGPRKVVVQGGTDGRFLPTGHLVYAREGILFAVPFDPGRLEATAGAVVMVDGVVESFGGGTGAAQFGISSTGTLVYIAGSATAKRSLVWLDRQGVEEVLPAEPRGYAYPRISPDGSRVALDSRDQQDNAIWIWNFAHETLTRLTFEKDALNAIWTPDGKRIIFSSGQAGTRSLFWKSADGTGAAEQLTKASTAQFPQSISPDGRFMVFREERSVTGGPTDLMLLPLAGNRQPAPLVQSQGSFQQRDGEISSDGRWLAYQSNESGQSEIYVRPFPEVGRGRWQVSNGGGTQPVWARSGRELYYVTTDHYLASLSIESGAGFAASKPVSVLDTRQFLVRAPGRSYDISPDGRRFLMIRDSTIERGQPQLVIVERWFDELRSRMNSAGR